MDKIAHRKHRSRVPVQIISSQTRRRDSSESNSTGCESYRSDDSKGEDIHSFTFSKSTYYATHSIFLFLFLFFVTIQHVNYGDITWVHSKTQLLVFRLLFLDSSSSKVSQ